MQQASTLITKRKGVCWFFFSVLHWGSIPDSHTRSWCCRLLFLLLSLFPAGEEIVAQTIAAEAVVGKPHQQTEVVPELLPEFASTGPIPASSVSSLPLPLSALKLLHSSSSSSHYLHNNFSSLSSVSTMCLTYRSTGFSEEQNPTQSSETETAKTQC
jgi:hypothetical protein